MPSILKDVIPGNKSARDAGYSAPYLFLLEEDESSEYSISKFSKKKLDAVERAIFSGLGQGRGDDYTPWIHIRRNFSSPVSYQVFDHVGIHGRNHHFLSKLEFDTALLNSFIGAEELRECLPMWPYEHANPASEDDGREVAGVPGLIEVARGLGIDHGCFIGSTVPYIASLDLMFCVRPKGKAKFIGISCKPTAIFNKSHRARERIALDAAYCAQIGSRHIRESGDMLDALVIAQLLWMRPLPSQLRLHRHDSRLIDFAGLFNVYCEHMVIRDAVDAAAQSTGASNNAWLFFRLGVWLHLIDIDLKKSIQTSRMIQRGGASAIHAWRNHYWGPHE